MAGTRDGGVKARDKMLDKDPNYYQKIGSIGGKVSHPNKGFGSNREMAVKYGKITRPRSKKTD